MLVWLALFAVGPSCVDVERRRGTVAVDERRLVAHGVATASAGGRIASRGPAHSDVALEVPPGAIASDREIRIFARYGDPRWPSIVIAFEIEPADLALAAPALLTIDYAVEYARAIGGVFDESGIEVYSTTHADGADLHPVVQRDGGRRCVTARVDRLGTFVAIHPQVWALALQPAGLLDPQRPHRADHLHGALVPAKNGRIELRVGRGDLASFWASGAADNLLVVHGLLGTGLEAALDGGLATSEPGRALNPYFRNVVVFRHPSGRAVADNANFLYDLIRDRASAGFGCHVIAHGTGGLVARYAIERSHADPARARHRATDPPLAERVETLISIGTPHHGSRQIAAGFAALLDEVSDADLRFVHGVLDSVPGLTSLTRSLNATPPPAPTRYLAIAGDVGGTAADGLVDVASAIGTPELWHGPSAFQVFSGPAFDHLALVAAAERSGVVEQCVAWLRASPRTQPIVGSVSTPREPCRGVTDLAFLVSDAEAESCHVAVQYQRDDGVWRPATEPGQPVTLVKFATALAPGARAVFAWDTESAGVGLERPEIVRVRIVPLAEGRVGAIGESGPFTVDNSPR